MQSLKILNKQFTNSIKVDFVSSIKKRINGKMLGVENHFRKSWVSDWFGIVDLEASWFKEMWSDSELELLSKIENELRHLGKIRAIETKIEPTDKLKYLCLEMHEEMKES